MLIRVCSTKNKDQIIIVNIFMLNLYVNDRLFTSTNKSQLEGFLQNLKKSSKLEILLFRIGKHRKKWNCSNQSKILYIRKILERFVYSVYHGLLQFCHHAYN